MVPCDFEVVTMSKVFIVSNTYLSRLTSSDLKKMPIFERFVFGEGHIIRKCLENKLRLAIRALTCGDDPRSDEKLSASGLRAMDLHWHARLLLLA